MKKRLITRDSDLLANVVHQHYVHCRPVYQKDNLSWSLKVPEVNHGNDHYLAKYEIMAQAQPGEVVLDVGCKSGDFISQYNPFFEKGVIRIGVDPNFYNILYHGHVNHYFEEAASDVDHPEKRQFDCYDEPGCSSLLRGSPELLQVRKVVGVKQVTVRSLESMLLDVVQPGTVVHYCKCDTQGSDLSAAKSLRSFLSKTRYIQLECSFDKEHPFYTGQSSYEEDIEEMDKLGFTPLYYQEYPDSPLSEGEILYVNKDI